MGAMDNDRGRPSVIALRRARLSGCCGSRPRYLYRKRAVLTRIIVVGAARRVTRGHRAKAPCSIKLPGLPDPLLGDHEPNGMSLEREVGQVLLVHQRSPVTSQAIEECKDRGSKPPF